jgi:Predicted ATPase (AAA+ superfamily)
MRKKLKYALQNGEYAGKMPSMISRVLEVPQASFFLLGPRGTGKSTWMAEHFRGAKTYDLLDQSEFLRLERDPHQLGRELELLERGSWVVIDEVQKVPALLDEVHRLIEKRGLRFVLCGSSARKLKRSGANLLGGRASVLRMPPLLSVELSAAFDAERAMLLGTLPKAVLGDDAKRFLLAYAALYLQEEIRAEALTRNVGAFSRFLEVAARQKRTGDQCVEYRARCRGRADHRAELLRDLGGHLAGPLAAAVEAQAGKQAGGTSQVLPLR